MTSPYEGATAVVLGASGFIGAWTTRALASQGARVHAVVRDVERAASLFETLDVVLLEADLAEPDAVAHVMARTRPHIVFNLAGYGVDPGERDPGAMERINVQLVGALCDSLMDSPTTEWQGLRLVHTGSALEYGRAEGPLHEELEPQPTTEYGRTKLAATGIVAAAGSQGLPALTARLFTVYGPGEHPARLLPSLLRLAREGGRLALTAGEQQRDFTFVGDVVEGLLRLGVHDVAPGTVVHLATGELRSVRSFAETAARVLGIEPGALDFGAVPTRPEEMFHGVVDVTRLQQILSWRPATSIAEGVRQTREAHT